MSEHVPEKDAVVQSLLQSVQSELNAMEALAEMARDEATSSETKAEGKYDTRATEAAYLARGQAWRIAELRKLVAWLSTDSVNRSLTEPIVQVGALVHLEGARTEWFFVAPTGGKDTQVDGQTIHVISTASPIGAAMVELQAGDAFEVDTPRGVQDYEILAIL